MDYSLLLGVDQERRELVGGIVDTIGSYTFAKTLEYNLKSNAARKPEEVTVVPPAEYQERFVNAMSKYFVACPGKYRSLQTKRHIQTVFTDKWSRPLDDTKIPGDYRQLPSVL